MVKVESFSNKFDIRIELSFLVTDCTGPGMIKKLSPIWFYERFSIVWHDIWRESFHTLGIIYERNNG